MKPIHFGIIIAVFMASHYGFADKAVTPIRVVKGSVKPASINTADAAVLAKEVIPCRIELLYPKTQSEFVEYLNGKWSYVIKLVVPRGRSSIHSGTLTVDGAEVAGSHGDRLLTPFGIMVFVENGHYFRGWTSISDHLGQPEPAEQGDAVQPATAPNSKSEGDEKPKPESEVSPQ
jgi:hypothetical protein